MTWFTVFLLTIIAWLVSRLLFTVDAYRQDLRDLRDQLHHLQSAVAGKVSSAVANAPANAQKTVAAHPAVTEKINLNAASKTQLQRLPKVGAVTAQRIIDARPFDDIDALKQVEGVTGSMFATLRPLVSL